MHNPRKPAGNLSLASFEAYRTKVHGDLRKANGTRGNAYYDVFMVRARLALRSLVCLALSMIAPPAR